MMKEWAEDDANLAFLSPAGSDPDHLGQFSLVTWSVHYVHEGTWADMQVVMVAPILSVLNIIYNGPI